MHAQMPRSFVTACPRMEEAVRRFGLPMTPTVMATGQIGILMAGGKLFPRLKDIK
jgi:hypothetical protein